LFNQGALKRRTTQMGLAPAPHLGGLMGSAGAKARAEAEARKRRVQARLSSAPPPRPTPSEPPPQESGHPHGVNQEELIEPLPAPFTGPAPALTPTHA